MDETKFLIEFAQPLQFTLREALDNTDPADPHRRQDEFDDEHTAPVGNAPLYDTSTSTPIRLSNASLTDFPDFSDQVMSDYKIQQMLGHNVKMPNIVDLDTAPNYVQFIKNSRIYNSPI